MLPWLLQATLLVTSAATEGPRLQYVATAYQKGPVGHRDPIGVLSPDGEWLAYTEGRFVRVQRTVGGPVRTLEPLRRDTRYLSWLPDSRSIVAADRGVGTEPTVWYRYDLETGERDESWLPFSPSDLRDLAFSPDGISFAVVERTRDGSRLWQSDMNGQNRRQTSSPQRLSHIAFRPQSDSIACLTLVDGVQRLNLTCNADSPTWLEGQEVYGPVAFSPDGGTLYYASPNQNGFLDLWAAQLEANTPKRLTSFARDTYAPSVDVSGRVLFKIQDYRPFIAMADASGGETTAVTTFMAETPSWSPAGDRIAFTFGNWRRVVDDFKYPDIEQHVGFVRTDAPLPAEAVHGIVNASLSEDQGQDYSPNGMWIAFHSHYGPSDDIWLVPEDHSRAPRQLTEGGYETAWPRWSPDGRWLVYSTQKGFEAPARLYLLGLDQETGKITRAETEIPLEGFSGELIHAEWTPDSDSVVFEAYLGPGRKAIYEIRRGGGTPRLIHAFESEEKYSGIGLSPDGKWIAYVARANGGFQQVLRVSSSGGEPFQVTTDPTHKTHPTYSPDGRHIAFTVWTYAAHFWLLTPDAR